MNMKKGFLKSFGVGILLFLIKGVIDHIESKREEARINEELNEMVNTKVEEALAKREEERRQRLLGCSTTTE